jgi:cell division protein FtsQ
VTDRPINKHTTRQSGVARLQVMVVSSILILSLALVALDRLFLPARFAINEVVVTGEAPNVDPATVLRAIKALGPRSWFSVDLEEVEVAVSQVPWVYHADVRRRWPGKLVVTVSQAIPFARWNDEAWINEKGEMLTLPGDFANAHLPRLSASADTAAADVVELYKRLSEPFLRTEDVSMLFLNVDSRGSIEIGISKDGLQTAPDVAVVVGREAHLERVKRLADVLANADLKIDLDVLEAIDLRYPNGFAIRPREDRPDGEKMAHSAKRRAAGDTG